MHNDKSKNILYDSTQHAKHDHDQRFFRKSSHLHIFFLIFFIHSLTIIIYCTHLKKIISHPTAYTRIYNFVRKVRWELRMKGKPLLHCVSCHRIPSGLAWFIMIIIINTLIHTFFHSNYYYTYGSNNNHSAFVSFIICVYVCITD